MPLTTQILVAVELVAIPQLNVLVASGPVWNALSVYYQFEAWLHVAKDVDMADITNMYESGFSLTMFVL